MDREVELSSFTKKYELRRLRKTEAAGGHQAERRLLRVGFVTLAVLCILQAVLNISLRLAFPSEEDVDSFPFNSSEIADLCTRDRSQQNSSQQCSCCNKLLKKLLRKYQALERERDVLQGQLDVDNFEESGSTPELHW